MSSTEKILVAIGAVVVIGAVMVAGAICYLSDSKNENKTNDSDNTLSNKDRFDTYSKNENKTNDSNNILPNKDRFDTYKEVVEEMIEKKEWNELESMLEKNLALEDFPEIIKMIKDALENK